jgi:hypothetical protein
MLTLGHDYTVAPPLSETPEPAPFGMVGVAMAGLVYLRRKRWAGFPFHLETAHGAIRLRGRVCVSGRQQLLISIRFATRFT